MTSKLEESAKAQQDALAEIFASQKPWDELSLPEQAARVVAQKAAVQALREPDEAMKKTAEEYFGEEAGFFWDGFDGVIGAVLQEDE